MRRLILALGAVSLLACGDSSGPGGSAVGTWSLVSVDEVDVPFTIDEFGTFKVEFISAQAVALPNGTFTITATFRETDAGTVTTITETNSGTWTQTNSTVTITDADGFVVTGSVSGNTLRYTADGIVLLWARVD